MPSSRRLIRTFVLHLKLIAMLEIHNNAVPWLPSTTLTVVVKVNILIASFSLEPSHKASLYIAYAAIHVVCLCQLAYVLLIMLCNCRTYMVSYRPTIVFIHCSILIGFHCFIFRRELSPITTYFSLCCLMSVLIYLGNHYLIVTFISLFRLLLSPFGWLSYYLGYYKGNIDYPSWDFMASMPLFEHGIWAFITALHVLIATILSWNTVFITGLYVGRCWSSYLFILRSLVFLVSYLRDYITFPLLMILLDVLSLFKEGIE